MRTLCPSCRRPIRIFTVTGDPTYTITVADYPRIGPVQRTDATTDTAIQAEQPFPGGWPVHTCAEEDRP